MQFGYMCDRNIVATTYYHGGMLVATTTTIDNTTRTVRHMAEAQRDAYEAFTENLAAAQSRSIGLANGGLEVMRLQEETAKAAQELFANSVRLLQLQQRNAEFVQGWTSDAVEALGEQTEHNVRTAEAFAQVISKQQEGLRILTQGWSGAYRDFFSPFAYAREGLRSVQRATRQGLEATQQIARQGLQATEQVAQQGVDRKSTRLNSSHANISYAVFCLKKKKKKNMISIFQHIIICHNIKYNLTDIIAMYLSPVLLRLD